MDLQVLVSTMNQTDQYLVEKMNIRSNAIIINQNQPLGQERFMFRGHQIDWYSFPERGVGKSRNIALFRAESDICLFADDDVRYHDRYSEIIINEFKKKRDADVIIFNVLSTNNARPEYNITRYQRIHFYNCLRYGTFRVAVRLDSIRKERLSFSVLFGGGSRYGSGEDSLFLMDCIRHGLHIYASPEIIGEVTHAESTWFSGYTEKFFYDKGALFYGISKYFSKLLCLQFCLRHHQMTTDIGLWKAYKCMLVGMRDYRNKK